MRPIGTDLRASVPVRLLAVAAALLITVGVVAAATHKPARSSVRVTAPASTPAAPDSPSTSSSSEPTTVTPPTAVTTTSALTATTAVESPEPSTTVAPATEQTPTECGPPPPASSATPAAGTSLYWIQNTSSASAADITSDGDGPHTVQPCETIGPFALTPQHDEPPTAGEDYVSVEQGQGCGYALGGVLFHVGNSYVLVLSDFTTPGPCPMTNPSPTGLHVHVFDRATGQQMDQ